ncbi:hypothetical protein JW926_12775, partial [Candidatus Sumerlaeota bacterium]|nr:hypothetical protein [Candidatus Sumerlaeota bacterium]
MKKFFFQGIVSGLMLLLISSVSAVTFSGGGGQGISVVDGSGGGDYTSLLQAAQDFNAYAGGCTGDWSLFIKSNLTEPVNVPFGNKTNGYIVTIKPFTGATPIITFTCPTKNPGWEGHLVIGSNDLTTDGDSITTEGMSLVVIDGSNTPGGTSRDLTITNTGTNASVNSILAHFVGKTENCIVKNCRIINNCSGNSGESIGVEFSSRYRKLDTISYHPKDCQVDNCEISCMGTVRGAIGILTRHIGSPAPAVGTAQSGLKVTNNVITASARAMYLQMIGSMTISGNTISVSSISFR